MSTDRVVLETSFLVDLQREGLAGFHGMASRFLENRLDTRFFVTLTTSGELAAAVSLSDRAEWERFIAPFHVLAPDARAAWHYGRAFRHLKNNGDMIGGNDLWIAATALAHEMPLVTRRVDTYQKIPHLTVFSYST